MPITTPRTELVEPCTRRAGVEIRELATSTEAARGAEVLREVWGGARVVLPANVMRAVQHTGGYVFGAYEAGGALVGVSVGFLADEGLHSHITGVRPSGQRRGLGFALKQHQRAWALTRGITRITWTSDPLVTRNVVFNLHALGAAVAHYLPNHYGAMDDEVNAGDESDRFSMRWDLASPRAVAAASARLPLVASAAPYVVGMGAHGGPVLVAADGPARRIQLPEDIESVRRANPALARDWRLAVRDAVCTGLTAGAEVAGLTANGALVMAQPS